MSARIDRDELRRRHQRRLELMVPAELEYLRPRTLFAGIPAKARDKVIEKVRKYIHVVRFEEGDVVLREGDYSDSAYHVVDGFAQVILRPAGAEPDRRPKVLGGAEPAAAAPADKPGTPGMIGRPTSGTMILSVAAEDLAARNRMLGPGELFGEIGALSRYPVSATVVAATPLTVLQVRLPGLRMLIAASKEFKKQLEERYRERVLALHLRKVPLFTPLDDAAIDDLKKQAQLQSFEPGQVIVQEGTPAEALFLVFGGYVKVAVRVGSSDLALTYLRKGDYAGEAGLLLDQPWPFTLQALEHVDVVRLPREAVRAVLAARPEIGDAMWAEAVARLKARGALVRSPTSSEYVRMAMDTGLIHGESVLLIDLATCTRCDECVRGCADAHGGEPRFVREGEKYRNWLVPTACYQCTDPVCMIDCPTGAITREAGTLEVTINEATCIGCSNCAERCPWDNIVMVERGEKRADGKPIEVATKCDLCETRPEGPACVQMCPHGSAVRISFKDLDRVRALLR
jgi:CRP-like cAMP-binding protein/Fe-S-cluster-containing hydrogenase component 2